MNSDKRLLLAVGLSFLILIFYPIYLKWVSPNSSQAHEATQSTPRTENEAADVVPLEQQKDLPQTPQTTPDRKENLYQFTHEHFNVEFSDRGGVITKLEVRKWDKKQEGETFLINRAEDGNGAFSVALPNQGIDFQDTIFSLQLLDQQKGEVQFTADEPGKWRAVKKFRFSKEQPVIWLDVELDNLSAQEQTASLELVSQLDVTFVQRNDRLQTEAFIALRDKLVSEKLNKIEKKPYVVDAEILWQALTRHYFALVIQPDIPVVFAKITAGKRGTEFMQTRLRFAPEAVAPNGSLKHSFLIYAGPQYYRQLKSFGQGFEQLLSHGFFGIFKFWLLFALQWTYGVIGNYGWAIVLVTFALKLLFAPLTHMSFESMKKMQALQPKLKALQEHHKNDQAKLSQEMMELYKKNKVNPMGGCLPMVLQIPIFIAFYQVLAQTVELKGEPFIFWIRDLSEPDRAWVLPFAVPFLGQNINILPLLMIGSQAWQQRLTPATGTSDQQKMMMFMPIVFGFIFYNLPSGLVLYWFLNNLLSIFHQLFIKGKALPHLTTN